MDAVSHFDTLGGYDLVEARYGMRQAHSLWDAARLVARDRGEPDEGRWQADYDAAWARAKSGTLPGA